MKSTVAEAHLAFSGDQTSRFFSRDALGQVFVVGFIKRSLVLHKSEINVTGLLKFVDLGHSTEPRWLQDAVESESNRQACVTSDGGMHMRIFFAC